MSTQDCAGGRDWAGLNVFGSVDAELRPPTPGERRVVFIGDDLTAHWEAVGSGLFSGTYLNRGIDGQTTPQMLVRFRQDVIDLRPKVVVIQGGLNDVAGLTGPATEYTISENVASMIDLAKSHRIQVVVASLSPVCDCGHNLSRRHPPGRIAGANIALRKLAEQTGSFYLNYYALLVEPRTRQMKKELTDDGLLPNAAGYALMAPLAEQSIQQALLRRDMK